MWQCVRLIWQYLMQWDSTFSWTWIFVLFRTSARVLLSSRKPAFYKPGKWRNLLYTGVASFAVGGGLCAIPFRQVSPRHIEVINIYNSMLLHTLFLVSSLCLCCRLKTSLTTLWSNEQLLWWQTAQAPFSLRPPWLL